LLIADGEPSDIDVNGSQCHVFDVGKTVEKNHRRGIYVRCMRLDPKADKYVSCIFSIHNSTMVEHIRRLPEKLPYLYVRLTY